MQLITLEIGLLGWLLIGLGLAGIVYFAWIKKKRTKSKWR